MKAEEFQMAKQTNPEGLTCEGCFFYNENIVRGTRCKLDDDFFKELDEAVGDCTERYDYIYIRKT